MKPLGQQLLEYIDYGKRGGNKGLSFGNLPKLRGLVPSLQRGTIYTLLGGTGSGKSILGVHNFGLEALLDYHKNYKDKGEMVFHWFLNSLEMDLETLLMRFTSYVLIRDHGKVVSTDYLKSVDDKVLPEDVEAIIRTNIAPMLDSITEYVTIYHRIGTDKLEKVLFDFYGKYGTFERDKFGDIVSYHSEKVVFCLVSVDHVALLSGEGSVKSRIDELASFEINMTTLFRTSFVNLQQLNRQEGEITKLLKMTTPKPALSEAKDSGTLIDASHVVVSLFPPNRFDIRVYLDVDISATEYGLKDNYRSLYVLKNRSGRVGMVHYAFYGVSGFFRELPELSKLTDKLKRMIQQSIPFWR